MILRVRAQKKIRRGLQTPRTNGVLNEDDEQVRPEKSVYQSPYAVPCVPLEAHTSSVLELRWQQPREPLRHDAPLETGSHEYGDA